MLSHQKSYNVQGVHCTMYKLTSQLSQLILGLQLYRLCTLRQQLLCGFTLFHCHHDDNHRHDLHHCHSHQFLTKDVWIQTNSIWQVPDDKYSTKDRSRMYFSYKCWSHNLKIFDVFYPTCQLDFTFLLVLFNSRRRNGHIVVSRPPSDWSTLVTTKTTTR